MNHFAILLAYLFEVIAILLFVLSANVAYHNHDWPQATYFLLLCFLAIWVCLKCWSKVKP